MGPSAAESRSPSLDTGAGPEQPTDLPRRALPGVLKLEPYLPVRDEPK
jgi:hypothetical protein